MAYEGYHLVCVHPFDHQKTGKKYSKGMMITDSKEVEMLHIDREHHFVRITAPNVAAPVEPVAPEAVVTDDNK